MKDWRIGVIICLPFLVACQKEPLPDSAQALNGLWEFVYGRQLKGQIAVIISFPNSASIEFHQDGEYTKVENEDQEKGRFYLSNVAQSDSLTFELEFKNNKPKIRLRKSTLSISGVIGTSDTLTLNYSSGSHVTWFKKYVRK